MVPACICVLSDCPNSLWCTGERGVHLSHDLDCLYNGEDDTNKSKIYPDVASVAVVLNDAPLTQMKEMVASSQTPPVST